MFLIFRAPAPSATFNPNSDFHVQTQIHPADDRIEEGKSYVVATICPKHKSRDHQPGFDGDKEDNVMVSNQKLTNGDCKITIHSQGDYDYHTISNPATPLKLELVKRNNMLWILCGGKVLLSREVPSSFPQDYLLHCQVAPE